MSWLWSWEGGLALAPALIAILLALSTRRVELSLLIGVVVGGWVVAKGAPLEALSHTFSYLVGALGYDVDTGAFWIGHLEISLFSVVVASSVAVMGATGGTQAVIQRVEALAQGRRGAMLSAYVAGMLVFFDDYANCLVVGNAMRPMCDRYGVGREKLAYIVDSTAAPIASLAVVSTWVGYELDLISAQLPVDGPTAMSVFIHSLPYRFYSLFTLVFVGMVAWSGRDFGPMLACEREASARPTEPLEPTTVSPWIAVLPVTLLVGGTLGWLVVDGTLALEQVPPGRLQLLIDVLAGSNPYHAMLFGSLLALVTAIGGGIVAGVETEHSYPRLVWSGASHILPALGVLFLAWALSSAMDDTGASGAIAGVLQERLPVWALPATTFGLAAGTAFATGTSFGTMGILLPIAVPVALSLAPGVDAILYGTTAAVLAGSCLGDHSSPISDTTVLSAVAVDVPLVDHVRTQAPYALTTGGIAVVFGYLPIGFGVPVWLCLLLGAVVTVVLIQVLGQLPKAGAP